MKVKKSLFLCIDQGTTSSKTSLISSSLEVLFTNQKQQENIYSKPGWSETNPVDLYNNVKELLEDSIKYYTNNLKADYDLVSLGITNQRESCLIWNKITGKPYNNAILWNDTRTEEICNGLVKFNGGDFEAYKNITGLPISTYFSAFKFKFMLENVNDLKHVLSNEKEYNDLCFGTIDSWLIYNLTSREKFFTDITNASRTFLFDINTSSYSELLLNIFGIKKNNLPTILSSSDEFGETSDLSMKIKITGVIGDQQSASIGHLLEENQVKCTYGTGGFLIMNTSKKRVISKNGLLTTVLYKNKNDDAFYALEGSIESAGNTISWLKNSINLFDNYETLDKLYESVNDSGDIYFVPSFSGLYSPHWDSTARASIQGMTFNTSKGHIIRAAFEAVSLRTRDVINSFEEDTNTKIHVVKVDGGMTQNKNFLNDLSDLTQCKIVKSINSEVTIIGAAICSGIGINVYKNFEDVKNHFLKSNDDECITPKLNFVSFERKYEKWMKAIENSKKWV